MDNFLGSTSFLRLIVNMRHYVTHVAMVGNSNIRVSKDWKASRPRIRLEFVLSQFLTISNLVLEWCNSKQGINWAD